MSALCRGRVLVVDDLADLRATVSGLLQDEGYDVRVAADRLEAQRWLAAERFDAAVLDVRLNEADEKNEDGLLLMRDIKAHAPSTAVIILTGYATVKIVREALERDLDGLPPAFGFLEKTEMDQLVPLVDRAVDGAKPSPVLSLADLVTQGESKYLEFKASLRWDYRTSMPNKALQEAVAIEIAGLLNSEGGTLLIGVADDGSVLGIEPDLSTVRRRNLDGFQLALMDALKTYLGLEHLGCLRVRFEQVAEKQVCVVTAEKSPLPVFVSSGNTHKFCVRMGNSTYTLDVKAATRYIHTHWDSDKSTL